MLTGSPIRQELFSGKREEGLSICGFDDSKPVIMIMGGSLGDVAINNAVREYDALCEGDSIPTGTPIKVIGVINDHTMLVEELNPTII